MDKKDIKRLENKDRKVIDRIKWISSVIKDHSDDLKTSDERDALMIVNAQMWVLEDMITEVLEPVGVNGELLTVFIRKLRELTKKRAGIKGDEKTY